MDLHTNWVQFEVEKYVAEAARAQSAASLGANRNRAHTNHTAPSALAAAPSVFFFGSALLTAKVSGVFQAGVTVGWTDSATADIITWAVVSHTSSTGTVTGGAAAGKSCFVSNNATIGLTPLGSANSIVQYQTNMQSVTGNLSNNFSWNGIINSQSNTTNPVAFTVGNFVTISLAITATNTITFNDLSIQLIELS